MLRHQTILTATLLVLWPGVSASADYTIRHRFDLGTTTTDGFIYNTSGTVQLPGYPAQRDVYRIRWELITTSTQFQVTNTDGIERFASIQCWIDNDMSDPFRTLFSGSYGPSGVGPFSLDPGESAIVTPPTPGMSYNLNLAPDNDLYAGPGTIPITYNISTRFLAGPQDLQFANVGGDIRTELKVLYYVTPTPASFVVLALFPIAHAGRKRRARRPTP